MAYYFKNVIRILLVMLLVDVKFNSASFNKYIHPMALFNISFVEFNKINNVVLINYAIYNINSITDNVKGYLVNILPENGCSKYTNSLLGNYIAIISNQGCSIEEKIKIALENKASAIILINNNNLIHLKITSYKNYVSTIVSLETGNILREYANLNGTTIEISRGKDLNMERNDHPAKGSIYFFIGSFITMIVVFLLWTFVVFLERRRFDRLKTYLNSSLRNAIGKALTRIPTYKFKEDCLESKNQCKLCNDAFKANDDVCKLPCNHVFHEKEIIAYVNKEMRCPTCRRHVIVKDDFKLRYVNYFGHLVKKYRLKPLLYNKLSNYLKDRHQAFHENRSIVIQINGFLESTNNEHQSVKDEQINEPILSEKKSNDTISNEFILENDQLDTIHEESEPELERK